MSDIYHGRLSCDGNGNLLADEGDRAGFPVAAHEGSYVFVQAGEPSHNARHHQQFVGMESTVDESMTDDPSLVNVSDSENQHHFGVLDDDPHRDGLVFDADAVAATATGHTEAYRA